MFKLKTGLLTDGRRDSHGRSHSGGGEHGHGHSSPGLSSSGNHCLTCSHGAMQDQSPGHGHRERACITGSIGNHNPGHLLYDSMARSVQWLNAHDPAECLNQDHLSPDCERTRCDHSELNTTGNVLVVVRANELITMSRINALLAITAVLYIAVNLVCAILNSFDNDCDPTVPGCSPATTPQTFHNLEFGATFVFTMIDLLALSYSPRILSNQYHNPVLLKLIVLVSVVMAFGSYLLVSINLDKFEVLAHELEYTNELAMTMFDALIFINLARGRVHEATGSGSEHRASILSLLVAACVVGVQLGIYNLSGWTVEGDSKGEVVAHYVEFAFNIASASITFWFTMDNKICADQRLRQIMYGDDRGNDNC